MVLSCVMICPSKLGSLFTSTGTNTLCFTLIVSGSSSSYATGLICLVILKGTTNVGKSLRATLEDHVQLQILGRQQHFLLPCLKQDIPALEVSIRLLVIADLTLQSQCGNLEAEACGKGWFWQTFSSSSCNSLQTVLISSSRLPHFDWKVSLCHYNIFIVPSTSFYIMTLPMNRSIRSTGIQIQRAKSNKLCLEQLQTNSLISEKRALMDQAQTKWIGSEEAMHSWCPCSAMLSGISFWGEVLKKDFSTQLTQIPDTLWSSYLNYKNQKQFQGENALTLSYQAMIIPMKQETKCWDTNSTQKSWASTSALSDSPLQCCNDCLGRHITGPRILPCKHRETKCYFLLMDIPSLSQLQNLLRCKKWPPHLCSS